MKWILSALGRANPKKKINIIAIADLKIIYSGLVVSLENWVDKNEKNLNVTVLVFQLYLLVDSITNIILHFN